MQILITDNFKKAINWTLQLLRDKEDSQQNKMDIDLKMKLKL